MSTDNGHRYTPTHMRLSPEDLAILEEIRQAHGLTNRTDAVRVAIRHECERIRKAAKTKG